VRRGRGGEGIIDREPAAAAALFAGHRKKIGNEVGVGQTGMTGFRVFEVIS